MERCPTQAVLPLVGLAAQKVIRDRYNHSANLHSDLVHSKAIPT
ncbi:MAG: hypothetical protein R6U98_33290 [Pirellulaceae bacterium]